MRNHHGYSLVELLVAMAMFMGVMMMTSSIFENILGKSGQQMKSAESQMEGIVGLEMIRYDTEHAGFGLPWSFQNRSTVSNYREVNPGTSLVTGVDASAYNDVPPNLPRAVVGGVTTTTSKILGGASNTNPGVDYLAIKSTMATLNSAGKKWSFMVYSATSAGNKSYIKAGGTTGDLTNTGQAATSDRFITVRSAFSTTGSLDKILVMNGSGFWQNMNTALNPVYMPPDSSQFYLVYGISNDNNPLMPYNRADFYVKRPSTVPKSCNAGTGILYKATANHLGSFTEYPLLDCVGDMQVILWIDMDDDGTPGTFSNQDGSSVTSTEGASATTVQATLASPSLIRKRLKQVQIYLLAHEGTKDRSFSYPATSIVVGDATLGRQWAVGAANPNNDLVTTFGADWKNYRWKVYSIVVRPKNLN